MKTRDLFHIDPSSPVPVYAQIEEQVKRLLVSGIFLAGEKLPSVRELALALKVNPMTVSKAYGRLSDRGIVQTRKGRGVFVSEESKPASAKEREKRLEKRIETLLAEAAQLGVSKERIIEMIEDF